MSIEPALEQLARRLPDRWMSAAAAGHRLTRPRYWNAIRHLRRFLAESERWSAEQLSDYQWRRLQALLEHAWRNVPYYREHLGADPREIRDWDDFRRLPFLTKRDLQEHGEQLVATNVGAAHRAYATSGGSTGIPVGFWYDVPASVVAEWAFMSRQWARVGYRDGDRCAILRGVPTGSGRLWDLEPFQAQLRLSSYHLSAEHFPSLLERLRRFAPRYLQAYPSSACLLAAWMLEHGEPPLDGLRAVLCGSETLYGWQREQLERAFACRIYTWYGLSERVCLAGECEHDQSLHIWPQYAVTELAAPGGRVIEAPGEVGEIVGTSLTTWAMPLIRYRTMDAAAYLDGPCPACGRPYRRFANIQGRIHEFIVSARGRRVSMTSINMHTGVFDNIVAFRFYQDTPGVVVLKIVPKPGTTAPVTEPQSAPSWRRSWRLISSWRGSRRSRRFR